MWVALHCRCVRASCLACRCRQGWLALILQVHSWQLCFLGHGWWGTGLARASAGCRGRRRPCAVPRLSAPARLTADKGACKRPG